MAGRARAGRSHRGACPAFFASARRSASDFAGTDGYTCSTSGAERHSSRWRRSSCPTGRGSAEDQRAEEERPVGEERAPSGAGLGDELAGDHAAGAGLVLDDERLAERLREPRRDELRGGVDVAARRVGHDQSHRLVRPLLRGRRRRGAEREHGEAHGGKLYGRLLLSGIVATVGGRPRREQPPRRGLFHIVDVFRPHRRTRAMSTIWTHMSCGRLTRAPGVACSPVMDLRRQPRARGDLLLITGIVVPRPIAWVTTLLAAVNLAPFSAFTFVSNKPMIGINVGRKAWPAQGHRPQHPRDRRVRRQHRRRDHDRAATLSSIEYAPEVSEADPRPGSRPEHRHPHALARHGPRQPRVPLHRAISPSARPARSSWWARSSCSTSATG